MFDNDICCCFTGHRPTLLLSEGDVSLETVRSKLFHSIGDAYYNQGKRVFICGMAVGFDMMAADGVLRLRRMINEGRAPEAGNIILWAAVPFKGQAKVWDKSWHDKYFELLEQADISTVISDDFTKSCMMERNRFMVDNSSLVIAWMSKMSGGTFNTVKYANKKSVPVINLSESAHAPLSLYYNENLYETPKENP